MLVERVGRLLWALLSLAVLVLVLKFFVADVYRVSSGSMRPTIFAGPLRQGDDPLREWVLVSYRRGAPERYDLVVWDRPGVGAVVKRVVGLPGEALRIVDGDLLIKGERPAATAPRPPPVVVFDSDLSPVEDYFHFRGEASGEPWSQEGRDWVLDALEIEAGSFGGMMSYHPELRDDYLDAHGRRVVGKRVVNDAIVSCEFQLEEGEGRLRFLLLEKADTFELRISPVGETSVATHRLELWRRSVGEPRPEGGAGECLGRSEVDLASRSWVALWFSNVDNHLEVRLDGRTELSHTYAKNRLRVERSPNSDQHVGSRVEFGGDGLRARFRGLRILRDLHYTKAPGEHGVRDTQHLGPDEVFLLGDNSAESLDSRTFGPVPVGELIGEASAVVWPPGMLRRLVPRR